WGASKEVLPSQLPVKVQLEEKNAETATVFKPKSAAAAAVSIAEPRAQEDDRAKAQKRVAQKGPTPPIPKKQKKRKMTVAEAREHLIEEEAARLIDMDSVTREAIERAGNSGIIFIDEIDKVAVSNEGRGGADVSRQGVQRDLLPIVEGSTVNTKHGVIKTDHVLFIAAGAFHIAKPSDLIPELQGRFPIRVELNSLTENDFVRILSEPQNALTKQYAALLESENVKLRFEEEAIAVMARMAFQVNQEVENIGARRLHTIMSNLLDDILFEVPDLNPESSFSISAKFVEEKLGEVVQKKDLSQYIL
ncbi:MAG: HslU--HslV peptidase ATPase subunit, partial [Bacteroidota bacterium]